MTEIRRKKLPVGISDFETIMTQDYYFVDKSLLIKEILDSGAAVTLIPRPRRFGKTLNLSMIKYFFEKTKKSKLHLFDNLKISKEPEYIKHQGQYPVIYLTFKDVVNLNWQDCYQSIQYLVSNEFRRHDYLLQENFLSDLEKKKFNEIISRQADQSRLESSLQNLSSYLYRYYKKKPIILIDEYDAPMLTGYINQYYDQVSNFMWNFLSSGMKDNFDIDFALIVGLLRIPEESIFGGLNNVDVCSILGNFYADKFGLTETEVLQIIDYYDLKQSDIPQIKAWYNGYKFGNKTIYNPWPVINLVADKGEILPRWSGTRNNTIIKEIFFNGDCDLKIDFETLLNKESIRKVIEENISFKQVFSGGDIVWSFMLFNGYLAFTDCVMENGSRYCNLRIPNIEVYSFFKEIVLDWFRSKIDLYLFNFVLKSLVVGNPGELKKLFSIFITKSLSVFDVRGDEPEKFYHAFVLGMLVSLGDHYEIKSNRESGYGRYDVMIIPKDKNQCGIIIEFKKVSHFRKETLETAAQNALKQIEEKQYEQELLYLGIKKIIKLAIVFDGKKTLIKEGNESF